MAVADADIAFATDLFSELGDLTTRKMFGGMCLYHQGVVFALLSSEGRLYLKVKGDLLGELKNAKSDQFHNMPYWPLPMSTSPILSPPRTPWITCRRRNWSSSP